MKKLILSVLFLFFVGMAIAQENNLPCTKEYDPVCGLQKIQCITTPCDPIEQTYNNRCLLDTNDGATYLYDGPCKEPTKSAVQLLFAQKFEKSIDQVQVTINYLSPTHMQGLVSIMEGLGIGGKFLALYKDNSREIVRYGDRPYEKATIEKYDFPKSWFADQNTDKPLILLKSQEEALQEAEKYIKNMDQYIENDGYDLELIDVLVMRCPGCWTFTYEFFFVSQRNDGSIDKAIVEITFGNGEIIDVEYTQKMFDPLLAQCKLYYDGCNTCGVEDGELTYCTEMYCMEYQEPKCLEYVQETDKYNALKKEIDLYIKNKLDILFADKTYNQKLIILQKVILKINTILSEIEHAERERKVYVFILDSLQSYKNTLENKDRDDPTQAITSEELLAREFKKLFMKKYDKKFDIVTIREIHLQEDHVRGQVVFNDGGPGSAGIFLATKIDGIWEIVFDGNGSYACEDIQKYDFPQEMITDCY